MKRVLMVGIVLFAALSASGCFLIVGDIFRTDITYEASYTGIGGMDITYVDEDGVVQTEHNVMFPWSRTFSVDNGNNTVMYVRVEANMLTNSVAAKVRADGAVVDSDSDLTEAWASYLVD